MPYYRAKFSYKCFRGHPNTMEMIYEASDPAKVWADAVQRELLCTPCPAGYSETRPGQVEVECKVQAITEDEYRSLGIPANRLL